METPTRLYGTSQDTSVDHPRLLRMAQTEHDELRRFCIVVCDDCADGVRAISAEPQALRPSA